MVSGTTFYLYDVWGSSPADVFAVGGRGTVLHYDGKSWEAMVSAKLKYATATEPPPAIELSSFTAEGGANHITLRWETVAEIDHEGFYLWRSEAVNGPYARINPDLIPGPRQPRHRRQLRICR